MSLRINPHFIMLILSAHLFTGCSNSISDFQVFPEQDKSRDGMFGAKDLKDLKAGIWIDPNGCQHWIIDDGVEGYLSQRLLPDDKPHCVDYLTPNQAIGRFQEGEWIIGDLF